MRRKLKPKTKRLTKTLLIDGEVLLKVGFNGTSQIQTEFGSIGTIYHFLNTIKIFYRDRFITKVVVFWEGDDSRAIRQVYYPRYKKNREEFNQLSEEQQEDLGKQRLRIQQYLEELYIRQITVPMSEADDCIAYYVQNSPNENKIIYTRDRDLLQLLDDKTKVYLQDKKLMVTLDNFHRHFNYHYSNVSIIKVIAGDQSDNIAGIQNIAEKTVLKLFPTLRDKELTIDEIKLESEKLLLSENVSNGNKNAIRRILGGETKWGAYGEDYFQVMDKVINLKNPIISDEGKEYVEDMINLPLDPEGRGGIQKINQMVREDGLMQLLPKTSANYSDFWQTFATIITEEQKKYNNYDGE